MTDYLSTLQILYVCMYLFAIDHKKVIIYVQVRSRIDNNNNVCDVKYITTYTDLVHHKISDGRDSLKKLLKVLMSIRVPLEL